MEAPATVRAAKSVMWTREDCRKMEIAGLLPERWELVRGEIINKMGTNLPHSMMAQCIAEWLAAVFTGGRILPTCSIDVFPEDNPTSEPEPDVTVLTRAARDLGRNPGPGDIEMIVEVSDTTLAHDLGPKAWLYARAGVPEYWVIDIKERRIHVHREPGSAGYASMQVFEADGEVSPLTRPDALLKLERLFA